MIETNIKAEKRFQELIDAAKNSQIDSPKFEIEKFLWVFGNLIQEYFADCIFEKVKNASAKDLQKTVQDSFETARKCFGEDHHRNWPFHRDWLKDYITWRFLGPRLGKSIEYKRCGGRDEFIKRNPQTNAVCQWYLGCAETSDLQVDHKQAWKMHGGSGSEAFQWLCRKHNNDWKKTLLFWGDNFIPFRDYKESDQPR